MAETSPVFDYQKVIIKMTKKIFLSFLAVVCAATVAFPLMALAQTGTAADQLRSSAEERQTETEQRQEELGQRAEERQQTLEERREGLQTSMTERRRNMIRKFTGLMIERFDAAAERLDKLAERIESRIGKFKAEGVDTSDSEQYLNEAKLKITAAKEEVSKILGAVETALSGEVGENTFKEVRTIINSAKEILMDTHALLVKAVRSLKPGFNKDDTSNATSTATTTP